MLISPSYGTASSAPRPEPWGHSRLPSSYRCLLPRHKKPSASVYAEADGSVILWGTYAFGEVNTELLRYFEYLGYNFIQGTPEQHEQAIKIAETMTPEKSSFEILDTEDFIIVKFG